MKSTPPVRKREKYLKLENSAFGIVKNVMLEASNVSKNKKDYRANIKKHSVTRVTNDREPLKEMTTPVAERII